MCVNNSFSTSLPEYGHVTIFSFSHCLVIFHCSFNLPIMNGEGSPVSIDPLSTLHKMSFVHFILGLFTFLLFGLENSFHILYFSPLSNI